MGNIQQKQETEAKEEDTNFTCEICFFPKRRSEKFNSNKCSHPFCTDCVTKYIETKLQERVNIRCPAWECNQSLDHLYCKPLLPRHVYDKWCDVLFESAVLKFENRVHCPNRDCSELIVDECGGGGVRKAACPKCKKLFCFRCAVPWHEGFGCQKKVRDANHDTFDALVEKKRWRKCPTCRHYVERNGGCKIIYCRCGTTFCYKCGRRIPGRGHWCYCDWKSFIRHHWMCLLYSIFFLYVNLYFALSRLF